MNVIGFIWLWEVSAVISDHTPVLILEVLSENLQLLHSAAMRWLVRQTWQPLLEGFFFVFFAWNIVMFWLAGAVRVICSPEPTMLSVSFETDVVLTSSLRCLDIPSETDVVLTSSLRQILSWLLTDVVLISQLRWMLSWHLHWGRCCLDISIDADVVLISPLWQMSWHLPWDGCCLDISVVVDVVLTSLLRQMLFWHLHWDRCCLDISFKVYVVSTSALIQMLCRRGIFLQLPSSEFGLKWLSCEPRCLEKR